MRSTLLFLILLLCLPSFAQKKNQDVVYLKNGSILRGTIVLIDPGKLIKLKTPDRNIWVFEQDKIDSIVRPTKIHLPQKTGYYNLTEFGVLAGNSNNSEKAPFTLMNVNNWQFANGLAAGIGVGVHFFNETYLPVVADVRYFLRKQGPLPFVSLQAGYSIPVGGQYTQSYYYAYTDVAKPAIYPYTSPTEQDASARGGFLVNPSIGFQTQLNESLALTFSAGYCYLRHRFGKEETYRMDVDYNRLSLKVGLQFK
jgi:hypothetical protein